MDKMVTTKRRHLRRVPDSLHRVTSLGLTCYASQISHHHQDIMVWLCHQTGLCPAGRIPNESMWRQMDVSSVSLVQLLLRRLLIIAAVLPLCFDPNEIVTTFCASAKLQSTGPNCGIELAACRLGHIKLLQIGCRNYQGTTRRVNPRCCSRRIAAEQEDEENAVEDDDGEEGPIISRINDV